jgi:Bul1 C terminus
MLQVNDRSKIEYQICVQVHSRSGGKNSLAAETVEQVKVVPVFQWWSRRHLHQVHRNFAFRDFVKVIKKGVFGKKKGKMNINIQVPEYYEIAVESTANSLSIPVNLRYYPASVDVPPNVTSLVAKLHSSTQYNVDAGRNSIFSGMYSSTVVMHRNWTPSPLTWANGIDPSGRVVFTSTFLLPASLPSLVGPSGKGTKLLPSFESCLVSRSYSIEVKISFEGRNELACRFPIQFLAKPKDEQVFNAVMESADEWLAGEELLRRPVDAEFMRPPSFESGVHPMDQALHGGGDAPPVYEINTTGNKSSMSGRLNPVAA